MERLKLEIRSLMMALNLEFKFKTAIIIFIACLIVLSVFISTGQAEQSKVVTSPTTGYDVNYVVKTTDTDHVKKNTHVAEESINHTSVHELSTENVIPQPDPFKERIKSFNERRAAMLAQLGVSSS